MNYQKAHTEIWGEGAHYEEHSTRSTARRRESQKNWLRTPPSHSWSLPCMKTCTCSMYLCRSDEGCQQHLTYQCRDRCRILDDHRQQASSPLPTEAEVRAPGHLPGHGGRAALCYSRYVISCDQHGAASIGDACVKRAENTCKFQMKADACVTQRPAPCPGNLPHLARDRQCNCQASQ